MKKHEAYSFAKDASPVYCSECKIEIPLERIKAYPGTKLCASCQSTAETKKSQDTQPASTGVFCYRCAKKGIKSEMVWRRPRGEFSKDDFLGCSRYPSCRNTLKAKQKSPSISDIEKLIDKANNTGIPKETPHTKQVPPQKKQTTSPQPISNHIPALTNPEPDEQKPYQPPSPPLQTESTLNVNQTSEPLLAAAKRYWEICSSLKEAPSKKTQELKQKAEDHFWMVVQNEGVGNTHAQKLLDNLNLIPAAESDTPKSPLTKQPTTTKQPPPIKQPPATTSTASTLKITNTEKNELTPTLEQKEIIEECLKEDASKIFAFAGAGKTATMRMIAQSPLGSQGKGIYLAFNKSIAQEANRTFPSNVDCRTMHSLAYKGSPPWLTAKLKGRPKMPLSKYIYHYQFELCHAITKEGKTTELDSIDIGRAIANSISYYCKSNSKEIMEYHVVLNPILDRDKNQQLIKSLLKPIRNHWEDCISPSFPYSITHDIYLKYYSLTDPKIEVDYILFDEAQDADPVIISILMQQSACKLISVGDPHQQIYSWRGSQDAMTLMKGKGFYLTKTFRFGRAIASLANAILRKLEETKIIIDNGKVAHVEWKLPHTFKEGAILCRTNKAAFRKYIDMFEKYDVALNINHDEILTFLKGAKKLVNGKKTASPESLSLFENWGEVVDYSKSGAGEDISYIVSLIEKLGIEAIQTALELSNKKEASITISTIHKAKGLEWDNVAINQDFTFGRNKQKEIELIPDEIRLLYVACTRAKKYLNVSQIAGNLSEFLGWRIIKQSPPPAQPESTNASNETQTSTDNNNPNTNYHEKISKIQEEHPKAYKPWTAEEEKELIKYFKEGKTPDEISILLKRQSGGITSRLKKLDLRF